MILKKSQNITPVKKLADNLDLIFFFSPISGNDSTVDGLVNFEKLRMIAKEIRHVVRLTSANMDPALMFRQRFVLFSCQEPSEQF